MIYIRDESLEKAERLAIARTAQSHDSKPVTKLLNQYLGRAKPRPQS